MMYKLDELTDAQALKRLHIYKDRDCERCANYPCGDFLDVIIENPAKCGCRDWEERKPPCGRTRKEKAKKKITMDYGARCAKCSNAKYSQDIGWYCATGNTKASFGGHRCGAYKEKKR